MMLFANLPLITVYLLSLAIFGHSFNLFHNIIENPITNMLINKNSYIEAIPSNQNDQRIQSFITEIENFENSDLSAKVNSLNNKNIYHYTQQEDVELGLFLQYKGEYILRLYGWSDNENGDIFYNSAIMIIHKMEVPVWETSKTHQFIDIQVTKSNGEKLLNALSKYEFKCKIIILDLPQTIFETFPSSQQQQQQQEELSVITDNDNNEISTNAEIFFKAYRDLDSIYAWYDLLVDTYPDILNVEYIGNTFEGRPMKALRLSVHSESKTNSIKTVVITSGIHAREWVSISSSCFILYQLLSDYENGNLAVKRYLEHLDFFFMPVMNPDGYEFTWKSERLWRKNRQQTFNPRCSGIDIDHSFGFQFTSGFESPCSDDYSGESEFEALESYNWDRYLNETKHDHPIYAYIDLHSYAEEVLYPYAYSCDVLPRDEENLLELAYGLSQAIRLKSGKYYEIVKACEDKGADLLPSMGAGSALDYMYHNKAYWAFVLKLRDSGTHGFLLPSKYIVPVGKEIYAAVKYFAAFLLSDKY